MLIGRGARERPPRSWKRYNTLEQAINALEHWNAAVEHLVQMNGDTVTVDQAWRIANDMEELALAMEHITVELGELAIQIAEECS
ncbi:hypothetical protein P7F73_04620 [Enterobacter sp. EC-ML 621]|uniref:hypothetical protein n=1 Tax=Enterobacter sp. EC-ML 621 TaxID=3037555 RepID=UPI0028539DBE|nr:hypothetical protein [Enterobacter sp. EC-ML 621]MDR5093118.1 hypothetical protein [Enterobacter sp. EC-ML 621]